MRSAVARAVRNRFASRLRDEIPQFKEWGDENVSSGDRLCRWQVAPGLTFYIMLQFHRLEDWFTVELAWSRSGQWPAVAPLPSAVDEEPVSGALRFRLGRLWAPPEKDVWWELAPKPLVEAGLDSFLNRVPEKDLLPKVEPAVENAIQHVVRDALPYFRKVATRLGISL